MGIDTFFMNNKLVMKWNIKYPTQFDEDTKILNIGCQEYTLDCWLENYYEIGRKFGLTDDQINQYHEIMLKLSNHDYSDFLNANCTPCEFWKDEDCKHEYRKDSWILSKFRCKFYQYEEN